MCTSPTFMLCTLVCFAALKFKCIFFYAAPFFTSSLPCFVCLSYFLPSSLLPNSLFVHVPFTPFILLPFPLNFPPSISSSLSIIIVTTHLLVCPFFFFIPSLHMLGIPIVTSSLFLPCALAPSLPLLMASLWLLPSTTLIPYLSPSCFFARKYGSWMAIPALFSLRRH